MARMGMSFVVAMAAWAMLAGAPAMAAPGDIFKAQAKATIDIGVDGGVEAVELTGVPGEDAPRIYGEQIRQWRFEPVLHDGQPVRARAYAELDVYMVEGHAGMLELSVGRPVFRSPPGLPDAHEITSKSGQRERLEVVQQTAPMFPTAQARRGLEADVIMLVEIGPSGAVQRSGVWSAHFMNLSPRDANERTMARYVAASRNALRRWRFNASSLESRRVLVPIAYRVHDANASTWRKIVPLPSMREAWVEQVMTPDSGAEESVADINDETNRFVLLNPPELPWM